MAQPTQEQLRQLFVDEVTEVLINLMHKGYTLKEIEQVAYDHFRDRVMGSSPRLTPDEYIRKKFGI